MLGHLCFDEIFIYLVLTFVSLFVLSQLASSQIETNKGENED